MQTNQLTPDTQKFIDEINKTKTVEELIAIFEKQSLDH
jgi:hypothetical protein